MDGKPSRDSGRRRFLKKALLSGLATAAGTSGIFRGRAWGATAASETGGRMPKRPFGKSGIEVPILALGGSQNLMNQQLLLAQALAMGVSYWDTADNYSGGRSEEGIGAYFARHPGDRRRVFLVTKSSASSPEGLSRSLEKSLRRLRTDYVDLFLLHGISRVEGTIGDETRRWVEQAKDDGRIRLFGFSTHRNMAACLAEAARLGWLDGIMLTYNYRLVGDPEMQAAVEACGRSGLGLIAMKTLGWSFAFGESEPGEALVRHFLGRGLNEHQAKLKAVWENRHIAGICSHMDSVRILKENVAAALDGQALTVRDRGVLEGHARRTSAAYCAGCGDICEGCLDAPVAVADVMRALMYAYGYNDYQMARDAFVRLPAETRARLRTMDFSVAERRCPRRMPIGVLMRQAAEELTTHVQQGNRHDLA